MISELYIPSGYVEHYKLSNGASNLKNLNKVNIFIGPNNSGKSRLMRALFSEDLQYQMQEMDFQSILPTAEVIHQAVNAAIQQSRFTSVSGSSINDVQAEISGIVEQLQKATLPKDSELFTKLYTFIKRLKHFEFTGGQQMKSFISTYHDPSQLVNTLRIIGEGHMDITKTAHGVVPEYKKIYIPILRGLRPLHYSKIDNQFAFETAHDNYKERTTRDYFKNSNLNKHEIFSGLSLYEDTANLLLGRLEGRKKVRDFENFLGKAFFGGESVSLTPNRADDCLYLTLADEDRPVYELGDGIQSLIILLYPLFFNRDKSLLVFIEEPELSLHPGMQRLFIDTIMKPEFRNHQFFLTTHSNHFLDMVLDHSQISIYNFKKNTAAKNSYEITNTNNSDINLLDSIGVRNSSVFLSNSTIWVEGITDRLYINKYLEAYQKSELGKQFEIKRFKEDLHYSFIEYGGANIVHFSFDDDYSWEKIKASSISNRILVVIDEDGTSKNTGKKNQRIKDLKAHLKENLIILPCREIENTLSPKVIASVIRQFEDNPELDYSGLSEDKYKNEYLGSFIEASIRGLRKKYATDSGTIREKVKFCKIALEHIHTIDDLSRSAKSITKKIYQFIKQNN